MFDLRERSLTQPLDRLLYLSTLPLFGRLPPEDLSVLAEHARERRFAKGEHLLREGEVVGAIHVVVEGSVQVSRRGRPFRVFGPKDAVGVFGLLAGVDEGVNAVALSDVSSLEFDAEALVGVFEDHFTILHRLIRATARLLIKERSQIPENAGLPTRVDTAAVPPARSLDLVERMFFLHRTLPFAKFSLTGLTGLAHRVTEVRHVAGETLWKEGDPAETMLLLVTGSVECAVASPEQRFRFGPGAAVGALDGLAGSPRWYTAITESEVVGFELRVEDLLDIFEDHFEMAMDFLAVLSRDVLAVFELRSGEASGEPPRPPAGGSVTRQSDGGATG